MPAAAAVLAAIGLATPWVPALAQTTGFNQCIQDGGIAECTKPIEGTPHYLFITPFALGVYYSEADVNAELVSYGYGYCSSFLNHSPAYTWTYASGTFPYAGYSTPIVETGITGHCDGGPTYPYENDWVVDKFVPQSCPVGWQEYTAPSAHFPTGYCYRTDIQCCQVNQPTQKVGKPIDVGNGSETEHEVDYPGSGPRSLRFERTYNYFGQVFDYSQPGRTLGLGWTHTYERRLWIDSSGTIRALRPDGSAHYFTPSGTGYVEHGTMVDQLVATGTSGYVLTDASDTIETYDASGTLQSIVYRGGYALALTYSTSSTSTAIAPYPGLLLTVSDPYGHQLSFTYAGTGLLATMTDPAGQTYTYTTSGGLLTQVAYPDSTTRQFLYDESTYTSGTDIPYAMTGIVDEAGTRYATITYNASGQATSSQLAGGVEHWTVSIYYNAYYGSGYNYVYDPLGNSYSYGYSVVNGPSRFTSLSGVCPSCGNVPNSVGYDTNGNVSYQQDFNGNKTALTYDTTRNLETSRTEALNSGGGSTGRSRTTTTAWDSSFRQPDSVSVYTGATASGTPLRTTSYTYDSLGNPLTRTVTDPATSTSRTWTYTYDSDGKVLTADGPRTDVTDTTTYTYYSCTTGSQCGLPHTVTDALSHTTTYTSYNGHGQPLTITDLNGTVTTLTYDNRLRVTSRQVGSETTSYSYYSTGLLQRVTLPDGSYVQYTYDAAHRLTQIADGAGNYIQYTLDAMGNRTAESAYDPTSTLSRTHTRVYNTLNQLYEDIGAANTFAVTTAYTYDSNGNAQGTYAPLSRNTVNHYDELNRIRQINNPAGGVTQFAYDATDNLTQVTDPNTFVTSYQYNGFGDLTQLTSPDTGVSTSTYDSGGNLATTTDARSAVATYGYDALNRVTSAAYSSGGTTSQTISYTYDSGANGVGHLTGASDANHSLAWTYDAQGRVTSKQQTVGSVALTVSYGYTSGNLTSLTTPSGQVVSYTYSNGQVSGISINSTTLLSSVAYEPFGPTRGWTWGNSTTEVRLHDTDGNPSQISAIESTSYTLDNAFRITGITNSSTSSLSWTYGYDYLDRLTSASTSSISQGWTYDANGNRLSQTGTTTATYTPSSTSNQLASITGTPARTYTYDGAGNTLSYSSASFTYNDRGRMASATASSATTNYVYDALGQRLRKSGGPAGTVISVFDEAGHIVGEYDGTGALIQETVWLGDTAVATIQPSGSGVAAYYVHSDHLNSPRMITRPSDNAIAWRWDTDPFGAAAPDQNPSGLGTFVYDLRFPGQDFDSASGLFYNMARDYDPQTGRYIESDPIGIDGGPNTYSYSAADPTDRDDPSGLFSVKPGVPFPSPALQSLLNCIEGPLGLRLYVTSTTEGNHQAPGHAAGTSVDIKPPAGTSPDSIFCASGLCGAAWGLDESKGQQQFKFTTGPNLHLQLKAPNHPNPRAPNAIPSVCHQGGCSR